MESVRGGHHRIVFKEPVTTVNSISPRSQEPPRGKGAGLLILQLPSVTGWWLLPKLLTCLQVQHQRQTRHVKASSSVCWGVRSARAIWVGLPKHKLLWGAEDGRSLEQLSTLQDARLLPSSMHTALQGRRCPSCDTRLQPGMYT